MDVTNPFSGLSEKSIHGALTKMAQRAIVAGYLQLFLFPLLAFATPEFRSDSFILSLWGLLFAVAGSRILHLRYGSKLFKYRHGVTIWRLWFTFGAQGIAAAWGFSTAYSFHRFGMSPMSMAMMVNCLATGAIVGASYAFDWKHAVVFLGIVVIPSMYVVMTEISTTGALQFALVGVGYLIYSISMARNLNRTEIQLLQNIEELERKEIELQKTYGELRQNHSLVQAMLESIDESFILLDSEGVCRSSVSSRSRELFGVETAGKTMAELLRIENHRIPAHNEWYRFLFSEKLDFLKAATLGPQRVELDNAKRVLALKYRPMRDADGTLKSVIFTATDVTSETRAKKDAAHAQERAEMILRFHDGKAGFRRVLVDFERLAKELRSFSGSELASLKRDLHTLKGTAQMYGLATLGKAVYEIELAIREAPEQALSELIHKSGADLVEKVREWKAREISILTQIGVYSDDVLELTPSKLGRLRQRSEPTQLAWLNQFVSEIQSGEFSDLLDGFENQVRSQAARLGKEVSLRIETPKELLDLDLEFYRDVLRTLVHVFNNSIDHGVESSEVRLARGKPAAGSITLSYGLHDNSGKPAIRLQIVDDGGGINVAKLREKLVFSGKKRAAEMSDLEIANQIFEAGVSTKSEVSDISGQGIGMGAVKSAIMRVRGKITVIETSERGTAFEILLPEVRRAPERAKVA